MPAQTSGFPDVSVLVVNWNTRNILRDLLASIFAETRGVSFEVIVVDNSSCDGSADMVSREFPQVILIANDANRGFGAANNQGMEIARGRYILLMNSDTVVLDGAIQKTVVFADGCPGAGVVGCRVLQADRTLSQTAVMLPSLLNMVLGLSRLDQLFQHHPFFDRERLGAWRYDTVRDVPSVVGCFMLLRREALRQVGGFDERYFMFCEEMDLCLRMRNAGWRLVFFPGAEILHLHGASSNLVPDKMNVQRRTSLLMFMTETRGRLAAWFANIIFLASTLARMPFWIFSSIRGKRSLNRPADLSSIYALLMFHALKAVWPAYIVSPRPVIKGRPRFLEEK